MNKAMSVAFVEAFKGRLKDTSPWEVPEAEWSKFVDASIYKGSGDNEYATIRALGSYGRKHRKGGGAVRTSPYKIEGRSPTIEDMRKYSLMLYLANGNMKDRQLAILKHPLPQKTILSKPVPSRSQGHLNTTDNAVKPFNGDLDTLRKILDALPPEYFNDCDKWLNVGYSLRNGGVPIELYREWSQHSYKYKDNDEIIAYRTPLNEPEKRRGLNAIIRDLEKENPEAYKKYVSSAKFSFPQTHHRYNTEFVCTMASKVRNESDYSVFTKNLVIYMNKWYALTRSNKEILVIIEKYDTDGNFELYDTCKVQAVRELFVRKKFFIPFLKRRSSPFDIWREHKLGRQYDDGMVFNINLDDGDTNSYNMYRGLAVQYSDDLPDVALAQPFIYHIREIWGEGGNNACYEYIMNWLAHIVQRPGVKTLTALCLHGEEGCGKGIIMELMKKIIGHEYFIVVYKKKDITGDFNGSLYGKLVCFIDEMAFTDNRDQSDLLKKLITENTILIEKKHKEPIEFKNTMNVVFASNHEHMVPAGIASRRYVVFALDNRYSSKNNHPGRKAYMDALLNTPIGAIARVLYERDISSFDPTDYPRTRGLRLQRRHSMDPMTKWWLDILESGSMKLHGRSHDIFDVAVQKGNVYKSYERFMGNNEKCGSTTFWRKVSAMCPKMRISTSEHRFRRRFEDEYGNVSGSAIDAVQVPSLEKARKCFREYINDPEWLFEG